MFVPREIVCVDIHRYVCVCTVGVCACVGVCVCKCVGVCVCIDRFPSSRDSEVSVSVT